MRAHFKQGLKHGPQASTTCTVFYPLKGGYLSDTIIYNHNKRSQEWIDEQIAAMRIELRSQAMQIEDFETRYNRTTKFNRSQTTKCR